MTRERSTSLYAACGSKFHPPGCLRHVFPAACRERIAALAAIDAAVKQEGGEELAAVEKRIADLKPKANVQEKHPAFGYHSSIESDQNREKWVARTRR